MEKASHDIEFSRENGTFFHFSLFFNIFIQVLPDYIPSSPWQSLPVFNHLNLFSEDAHAERSQDLLSACSERDLLFIFPAISVHLCALVEMLLDPKKFIDETSRFRKETKAEKYQNGRWHFVIQYLCCLRHIYTVFKQDQSVQNCC